MADSRMTLALILDLRYTELRRMLFASQSGAQEARGSFPTLCLSRSPAKAESECLHLFILVCYGESHQHSHAPQQRCKRGPESSWKKGKEPWLLEQRENQQL